MSKISEIDQFLLEALMTKETCNPTGRLRVQLRVVL